jgi:hypothetical protein
VKNEVMVATHTERLDFSVIPVGRAKKKNLAHDLDQSPTVRARGAPGTLNIAEA